MTKPGHEQPEYDYRSFAEGTLFAQGVEQETGEAQPEAPEAEVGAIAVKPVAEIMEEHERRTAERAQRWLDLTDSNWPPGRIEQQLDIEFPDLKSAEKIEAEDLKRDAATRRHAEALHGPKRQRSRRLRNTRSPRDYGPPPHIAEDVRRAQGLIE